MALSDRLTLRRSRSEQIVRARACFDAALAIDLQGRTPETLATLTAAIEWYHYAVQFEDRSKAKRLGSVIREEMYDPLCTQSFPDLKRLSSDGVAWLQREIRSVQRSEFKEWAAILTPILAFVASTIIAILGLLVALRNTSPCVLRRSAQL